MTYEMKKPPLVDTGVDGWSLGQYVSPPRCETHSHDHEQLTVSHYGNFVT
jgi:hypothetical protein